MAFKRLVTFRWLLALGFQSRDESPHEYRFREGHVIGHTKMMIQSEGCSNMKLAPSVSVCVSRGDEIMELFFFVSVVHFCDNKRTMGLGWPGEKEVFRLQFEKLTKICCSEKFFCRFPPFSPSSTPLFVPNLISLISRCFRVKAGRKTSPAIAAFNLEIALALVVLAYSIAVQYRNGNNPKPPKCFTEPLMR